MRNVTPANSEGNLYYSFHAGPKLENHPLSSYDVTIANIASVDKNDIIPYRLSNQNKQFAAHLGA